MSETTNIQKRPWWFRLKKVNRYWALYGWPRTRAKIRAERHMNKRYRKLPTPPQEFMPSQRVGMIGCGRYAYSTIAYFLRENYGRVLAAVMDKELHRAASLAQAYSAGFYTDDVERVIQSDRAELLYIVSNHASHCEYAVRALRAGKHVYIEKPPVGDEAQLAELLDAAEHSEGKIFLGYNRPVSQYGKLALDYLRGQPGPGVYNWFVTGMLLPDDHWYNRPGEGGRVLGNLCHWTDYIWHLFGENAYPVEIIPVRCDKPDENIAVAFKTFDNHVAALTYSATGYAFEGVRERFNAQRGACVVTLEDFNRLRIDVLDRTLWRTSRRRDPGHEANICYAYDCVFNGADYDRAAMVNRLAQTSWLMLQTRAALEANTPLTIGRYEVRYRAARAEATPADAAPAEPARDAAAPADPQ